MPRLQDAHSLASPRSALETNYLSASAPPSPADAGYSPAYNASADAPASRPSRRPAIRGIDHSRHCGWFLGLPSRASGPASLPSNARSQPPRSHAISPRAPQASMPISTGDGAQDGFHHTGPVENKSTMTAFQTPARSL